jgi:hypothetical protein
MELEPGFLFRGMQPHTGSAVQDRSAKLPFTLEVYMQPAKAAFL